MMKPKLVIALATVGVSLLWGGAPAAAQKIYPVQGPQAGLMPAVFFDVKLTGNPSGKFSTILANGEQFQGKWTSGVANRVNPYTPENPIPSLPQDNLQFAWDAVYGQGYFVANVLGEEVGTVVATGDKGTILQLEFLYLHHGVGVDNKGNLYKVIW